MSLLPAIFNDVVLLKIVPRVVIGFFVTNIMEDSTYPTLQSKGIEFMSVMNFSLQPNEKKEKFASEVGKVYSKFRYSLLMSSFLAMQRNAFRKFKTDSTESVCVVPAGSMDGESLGGHNTLTMLQPFWLKPCLLYTSDAADD